MNDHAIRVPTLLEAHIASAKKVGLGFKSRYSVISPAGVLCLSYSGAEQTIDASMSLVDKLPQSSRASLKASKQSSRMEIPQERVNAVWPTPTTATFLPILRHHCSLAPHFRQYFDSCGKYSVPHLSHLIMYGP